VDDDLTRLAADLRERELLKARRAGITAATATLTADLDDLRRRHAIEQRDVDRLETFSLTRLLADLRGAREQALDRERAEAEAARYRVAQAQDRLDALRAQAAAVESRLRATETAPGTYAALLAEKERRLRATGAGPGGRLTELAEERGRLTAELKELTEAEAAARAAARALADANALLESADNWSGFDTFLGGGGISSMIKHNRLDEAAALAAEADRRLAVLQAELRDVDPAAPSLAAPLRLGGFTRFADVWLDNIFTDLSVRSQIKDGLGQLGTAARQVGRIRAALAARIAGNRRELARLDQERTDLLRP
jgi:DNA repair exonuclease SbcCD ATPase subunit